VIWSICFATNSELGGCDRGFTGFVLVPVVFSEDADMKRIAAAWVLVVALQVVGAEQSVNAPTTAPPGSWVKLTDHAAFSPRDTAEDLVFDGKMWLSNGWYHNNTHSRDLWRSTDGVAWTRLSDQTPYDVYSEMVVYKDKIWAIKASVWCSTNGKDWTRVAEKTPFGARGYGELVVFKDKMWQLGSGQDVWNTDDGIHWTCVCPKAPYGDRAASAVVPFADKLWLMGGRTPVPNTPPEKGYKNMTTHNDVWSSPDGQNWTQVTPHAPWAPRQWHISKVYRDRIWVIGGHDNVNSYNHGDVWWTTDGAQWHRFVSPTTFAPRHEVTAYVYQDSLWVVAGNTWPVVNDVWRLTLPKGERSGPERK